MKESTNNLWELIHSLNMQERLFFRRDFNKNLISGDDHKVPLYLRLFDAICKQKKYDEGLLLQHLAPHISKKNISYLKNYLHENISAALIELNSRKDIQVDLFRKITWVRILRNKNLFAQAQKLVESLIQPAIESGSYLLYQELMQEYRKLLWYEIPTASHLELKEHINQLQQHNNTYSREITFQAIYYRTLLLKRKTHFKPDEGELKEIQALFNELHSLHISDHDSFLLKHYYKMTNAILLYLQGDERANKFAYDNILSWQNNHQRILDDPENYTEALYTYNYTAIHARDYQQVIMIMLNPANEVIENEVKKHFCETIQYLGLNRAYNKSGNYEKVREVLPYMKLKEPEWVASINVEMRITLYLSIGIACFVLDEYDDAYFYIKNASYHFGSQTRKEHLSFAFLFLLIICFEKRDYYLFDNQYNNTYNFFYKKEKPQPFEKAIMQTLKKLINPLYEKERQQLIEQLLETLDLGKTDNIQQGVFSLFNIPRWLESKAKSIPYRVLVQQYVEHEKNEINKVSSN